MEDAAARWRYDQKHKEKPFHNGDLHTNNPAAWSSTRSDSHPFHYLDGVALWVSEDDLTPDDLFI